MHYRRDITISFSDVFYFDYHLDFQGILMLKDYFSLTGKTGRYFMQL